MFTENDEKHLKRILEILYMRDEFESPASCRMLQEVARLVDINNPQTKPRLEVVERELEQLNNLMDQLAPLPKTRLGKEGYDILHQFLEDRYSSRFKDYY